MKVVVQDQGFEKDRQNDLGFVDPGLGPFGGHHCAVDENFIINNKGKKFSGKRCLSNVQPKGLWGLNLLERAQGEELEAAEIHLQR